MLGYRVAVNNLEALWGENVTRLMFTIFVPGFFFFFGALCASEAYLVSELQTVPQRQVLLDDNGLVRFLFLERGQFRKRFG